MTKPRTTVLHIISSLPAHGAEQLLLDMLENADHTRFRFLVCTVAGGGPLVEEIRRRGTEVFVFQKRFRFDASILLKLKRLIQQEKVDLVHTHLFTADAWGRLAAVWAGVPAMVRSAHNSDIWKRWSHRIVDSMLLRRTCKIIAVSDSVKEYLKSLENVPEEKIVTVTNGINTKRFEKPVDTDAIKESLGIRRTDRVIGIMGRLEAVKGHHVFLEAAQQLTLKHDALRFLIVGDGPLRAELKEKVDHSNLREKVIFTGLRRDIPDLMKILDCLVLPSTREGLPIVLLEAMAAGVPIVATTVGGIPEVISNDVHGKLIAPNDSSALVTAVDWILNHPEQAQEMVGRARARVASDYSVARTARQIEAVYEEVLGHTTRPAREQRPSTLRRHIVSGLSTGLYPTSRLKATLAGKGIRFLTYHRIAEVSEFDQLVVSPPRFREQMRFLRNEGIPVLSFDEAIDCLEGKAPLPPRAVTLTFDDGYRDNYDTAFPVLREYQLPAIVFAVPGLVDGSAKLPRYDRSPTRMYLSWDELREMADHGFRVGSHSCTHANLTDLPPHAAQREILESKRILEEQLNQPVDFFCYPRGKYHRHHALMVRDCLYRAACSTRPGSNRPGGNPYAIRRTEISPNDTLWDFKKKLAGAYDLLHGAWQWSQDHLRSLNYQSSR
jgi:glycosyltransferase involved in cell wall biosynthesis/peptidoglycan/xylan/chitin deacetylase (PgdA/CDA1 family)